VVGGYGVYLRRTTQNGRRKPRAHSYQERGTFRSCGREQISAEAYIAAHVPVLGYIPQPAEEDYDTRIARREVWLIERDEHAMGVGVLEERPDHLLVQSIAVRPTEQREAMGEPCSPLPTGEPSRSVFRKSGSSRIPG
jgi:hypothetical protein